MAPAAPAIDVEVAARQVWGVDAFRRRAHEGGIAERKAMIDREHDLSITRQEGLVYALKKQGSSNLHLPQRFPICGYSLFWYFAGLGLFGLRLRFWE